MWCPLGLGNVINASSVFWLSIVSSPSIIVYGDVTILYPPVLILFPNINSWLFMYTLLSSYIVIPLELINVVPVTPLLTTQPLQLNILTLEVAWPT